MKFTEEQITAKIKESAGQLTRKDAEEILRNQAEHDFAIGLTAAKTDFGDPIETRGGKKAKKA